MSGIAGLLLAAGASRRMGRPKQLLRAGERSLLDHVLSSVMDSQLDPVILVLGHEAARIERELETTLHRPRLRIIRNGNYGSGISTSIIAGLSEVENDYDNVMIILADMPYITSQVIDRLIRRYLQSGLPLGAVTTGARRTPPVVINRKLYHELHQLRGDTGARDLFRKYPDQVCLMALDKGDEGADINTPEDYRKFQRRMKNTVTP